MMYLLYEIEWSNSGMFKTPLSVHHTEEFADMQREFEINFNGKSEAALEIVPIWCPDK